mgnify:CR=1 FL=1
MSRHPRILWTIFLLALSVRMIPVALVADRPWRMIAGDSGDYLRMGENILAGRGFTIAVEPPYLPNAARTPVYPLFLAGIRAMAGPGLLWIALAQALCGALTAVLVWSLARMADPRPRVALVAALLYVFLPVALAYGALVMTETLFTLLIVGALWLTFRGAGALSSRSRLRWAAAAGLAGGAAVLCRPIAVGLPFLLAAALAVAPRVASAHRGSSRPAVRADLPSSLTCLAAAVLICLPWIARNHAVTGRPVVSTIGAYNLLAYGAAPLKAEIEGSRVEAARESLLAEAIRDSRRGSMERPATVTSKAVTGELPRVASLERVAWDWIRRHPWRYLRLHLVSDLSALLPAPEILQVAGMDTAGRGTLDRLREKGPLEAAKTFFAGRPGAAAVLGIFAAGLLGLYIAGGLGAFGLLRRAPPAAPPVHEGGWTGGTARRWSVWPLAGMALYLLLAPGPASTPRFRVPVMPVICLLAACGLSGRTQGEPQDRSRS